MLLNVLLGVGFAVYAAACCIGVLWASSVLSGWNELAERFRYRGRFEGKMYRFRKRGPSRWPVLGDMGGFGTLNEGMTEEGLYLVPIIPARLFHPPLLIPWGEMEATPYGRFFFGYRVRIRSVPDVTLYCGDWFYAAAAYLKDLKSPEEHLASR